ncbi:2,3-bisphosphoglycerate-dependent phosphoglycerate mutase isoform X2 [Drosophila obscura]|uniref:2,3-bisphosphoglycerate-dependent phosphoglycerate mutase isoform X2 n=1 Tax=Drosophila obscura TaxID=7282 RepID=UPI000BA08FA0|nr:2,3-bisphosphoglycerate-dependent phosphoglycerate mutase isoform X2 [Drosophila obscura]
MAILKFLQNKLSQYMMKTNRLVLLRHGESEFNLENKFCGWHDAPLTENGEREACMVATPALLESQLDFDVVYTSVLDRSKKTADLILSNMDRAHVPVKADWRLCERHYGNLTGFGKREIANIYGEDQVQAWRRGYDDVPPAINLENRYYYTIRNNHIFDDVPAGQFPLTESLGMCVDRVEPVWQEIKQEVLNGTRVLICVHGTVTRALVKHIEGISKEAIQKVNIPNCIPRVYEFNMKTGELLGGAVNLGDPEYIKKKTAQVAAIGD